jgi:hypothetical protein
MSFGEFSGILLVYFIIPLLILGVIAVVVREIRRANRRTKAMEEAADQLGFAYSRKQSLPNVSEEFSFVTMRGTKWCRNWMQGRAHDFGVTIFEYIKGDPESDFLHSVVWFECEQLELPRFEAAIGKKYSTKLAKHFNLSPDDLSKLGDVTRGAAWTVEGLGKNLIAYRPRVRIEPKDLPKFLEDGLQIANLLTNAQIKSDTDLPTV